jgi:hypothetical protein
MPISSGEPIMSLRALVVLCLALALPNAAHATQVCAWLVEANAADNEIDFELWLQSDGDTDFFYQITGEGVVTDSSQSHSKNSGTYSLHAGQASKVWGFGTTVNPPARIDIGIELHQMPASIFSDESTPLLAAFAFKRNVPESETKAPATLAKKQCTALKAVP